MKNLKELLEEMILKEMAAKNKVSEETISESSRGDIVIVRGADNTEHKAVMINSMDAVYLEDDGSVEPVPDKAMKTAKKATRTTTAEKELAKKFLSNMKESVDLIEAEDIQRHMEKNDVYIGDEIVNLKGQKVKNSIYLGWNAYAMIIPGKRVEIYNTESMGGKQTVIHLTLEGAKALGKVR